MSQEDKESRTEEATEKKISDAVERGNIPRSRELSVFASLIGILLVFAFIIRIIFGFGLPLFGFILCLNFLLLLGGGKTTHIVARAALNGLFCACECLECLTRRRNIGNASRFRWQGLGGV